MKHCTRDPNTCRSGWCNWPACQREPIANLGDAFTEANDKPLEREWSRLERWGLNILAVLVIAGVVAYVYFYCVLPYVLIT